MYSYVFLPNFNQNFIEKFFWESGFSNFGHMALLLK